MKEPVAGPEAGKKGVGNITEITTVDVNRFLGGLKGLGPVSPNTIRRNLITVFSFAKKQDYPSV